MSKMPDGNTAALRQFENAQAKANAIYECYGSRVEDDFVSAILAGETVKVFGKPYAAVDFIDGNVDHSMSLEMFVDPDDVAALITNSGERALNVRERLQKKLEAAVRCWLENSPKATDWVDQRCRDWNEDDQQRHGI